MRVRTVTLPGVVSGLLDALASAVNGCTVTKPSLPSWTGGHVDVVRQKRNRSKVDFVDDPESFGGQPGRRRGWDGEGCTRTADDVISDCAYAPLFEHTAGTESGTTLTIGIVTFFGRRVTKTKTIDGEKTRRSVQRFSNARATLLINVKYVATTVSAFHFAKLAVRIPFNRRLYNY